jgi:acetyltransferase-like isoleucine patch superfamily enzyme
MLKSPTIVNPLIHMDAFHDPELMELVDIGKPVVERLFRVLRRGVRRPFWRWRLSAFGAGSDIAAPTHIVGGLGIAIGQRVRIWHSARIEALKTTAGQGRIRIGDQTVIQPHVHIGAAKSIEIGVGVLIASHVYMTDHDHDFADASTPPIKNRRLMVAPVSIGDYAWLGERVTILKGANVGEHSVIGAGAVVTRPIPPFSVAVGIPARVIQRFDFKLGKWARIEV